MPGSLPTFEPTLILRGGAGFFQRSTLSPERHVQYQASLKSHLHSTYALLNDGATALDAVVHAVSLMEDDPLFDAGRGSVFTSEGKVEMEASVMVTSIRGDWKAHGNNGSLKRGAGVLLVNNNLANEIEEFAKTQGTVGCVCLDQWGDIAVGTSTGRLVNKAPGRVADTIIGSGTWAESWEGTRATQSKGQSSDNTPTSHVRTQGAVGVSCTGNGDTFLRANAASTAAAMARFGSPLESELRTGLAQGATAVAGPGGELQSCAGPWWMKAGEGRRGMIGIEIEVNIELPTDGSSEPGQQGENGSNIRSNLHTGKVVFDFNGPSLWRAWIDTTDDGEVVEKVMVFREDC